MKDRIPYERDLIKLRDRFLDSLYDCEPRTAVSLIGTIAVAWGYKRVRDGDSTDERGVAALFCQELSGYIEKYKLEFSRNPGTVQLDHRHASQEGRDWAEQWGQFPFDRALKEFTFAVTEWLRTVDLRHEIRDNSANQMIYYFRCWYLDLV